MEKKIKNIVNPSDIFVEIEYLQGFSRGKLLHCTIKDIIQKSSVSNRIPRDVQNYILEIYNSLTFDDLVEYDGDLHFLNGCFSTYVDFLKYIFSRKCYTAGYYYSRNNTRPFCVIDFYIFV